MRIACLLMALVYLNGCSTMNRVDFATAGIASSLKVGDEVFLLSRNGKSREFTVTKLTPDEVCGAGECVRIDEITAVERSEFSAAKTTLLVVAILAVVVLVGLASASPGLPR
jgi:hypothetical protein